MNGPAIDAGDLFSLAGTLLVGVGLYGFIIHAHLLRRVLAFNVIGSGIFLIFGALGFFGPGQGTDPVPQALVITGIVVAFALTGLAVALIVRLAEGDRRASLPEEDRTTDLE